MLGAIKPVACAKFDESVRLVDALDAASLLGYRIDATIEFVHRCKTYRAGYERWSVESDKYYALVLVGLVWKKVPRDHGRWGEFKEVGA